MAIKIGEILVSRGLITNAQLEAALVHQKRSGNRLGVCLVRLGFISEERLAAILGEQLRVPVVAPGMLEDVPPDVIARVPAQVAETHRIVPVRAAGRELHVCLSDPQNLPRLDEIAFALGCRIRPVLATEPAIDRALARYYSRTDIWDQTASPSEWRVEESGTWRISLPSQELPVVEAVAEVLAEAEPDVPAAVEPYERLSTVMTRDDLAAAVSDFFGRYFRDLCLLEIVGQSGQFVALRRAGEVRPLSSFGKITLDNAAWVQELVQRPQVALRQTASDPHQQVMLESLGLTPRLICIVPIFDYGQLRYVLLGLGLDEGPLKAAFDAFKPYLVSMTEALRILVLRDQIRARGLNPS